MTDRDGLYELKIRGEKHTYSLRGSELHSLDTMAGTLSDLTGYRKDFIIRDRRQGLRRMSIGEERRILPANIIGTVPVYLVKRVS